MNIPTPCRYLSQIISSSYGKNFRDPSSPNFIILVERINYNNYGFHYATQTM